MRECVAKEPGLNDTKENQIIINVTGTAITASIVTVNEQPTTRLGEYFAGTASGDNSTGTTKITANIHAVNPGAGSNGEDVVSTATKSEIVPPEEEAFTYDDDGNLTSDGKWTYTWDAENRLITITPKSGNEALIGKKLTFGYDTDAKRIWQDIANWNAGTSAWDIPTRERYCYDGWNLLIIADDTFTTASKRFTWGYDLSNTLEKAGGIGGLLLSHANAVDATAMYDGNGNVNALSNDTSTLIGRYEYSPFGKLLSASDEQLLEHPFQWSTKFSISCTNLICYGYRYCDLKLGRWLNRDPVRERGGLNLYGFCHNSPISYHDPDGRFVNIAGGVISVGMGWGIAKLTGSDYTLTEAAVDFGFGALGPGLAKRGYDALKLCKKVRVTAKASVQVSNRVRHARDPADAANLIDYAYKSLRLEWGLRVELEKKAWEFVGIATYHSFKAIAKDAYETYLDSDNTLEIFIYKSFDKQGNESERTIKFREYSDNSPLLNTPLH